MADDGDGTNERSSRASTVVTLLGVGLGAPLVVVFLMVTIADSQKQRPVAWEFFAKLRARDVAGVTALTAEPLRGAALRCLAGRCDGADPVETALRSVLRSQIEFGGTTSAGDDERCYEATARGDAGQHDLRVHLVEQGGRWVLDALSTEGGCGDD